MAGKGKPIGTVFVELDLSADAYTKKEKEIINQARTTSLDMEKNFRTLGSHSDKMYDAMRQRAINSLNAITHSSKSSTDEIVRAQKAAQEKIKKINEQQYGHHVSFTERLKKNWQEVAAAAYLAYKAFQTGKEMIDAALAMERITISMNAVTDNTTLAAREVQYLREESERLGLVFNDATVEYVKFAAAAKNTSIEGEQTRKIFTGISEAITALKLSTMDANLIYMAMTQMISKGKVSMEELRRQMGERLPGAIRLAAEGMGMTTMELIKQIEAGKVMATDLLPKLAEQLHKTYGQAAMEAAQAGQAAINRYHNTMFETKAIIGQAIMPVFTDLLNLIRQGVPYAGQFAIGFKLAVVDVAASVDKIVYYFRNIKTFMFGSPEEVAELRASMKETFGIIDSAAESMKKSIYGGGVSSSKTATELAIEAAKTSAAKTKEVVKDVDAGLKSLQERVTNDTAKNSLTEIEFIEYTASQYLKKGLSQVEVDKWKSSEIEKINQKEADKVLKIQQDASEAIGKHRESATKEYEKLLVDEADFAMTENERQIAAIEKQEQEKLWKINVMLQEETISWEQYEKAKAGITTNAAKARLANETENAKRIASINYNLVQDILGMEETAFNLRMEMIEAEKKKYIADGGDIVYAARWAANQQTKALINLGKRSDDVASGMRAAFSQMYLDQLTWGQAGFDMTMGFYGATSNSFSSMIYDMKGGMSSFSDYWDVFTDSLWKVFADMTAKMVTQWLWAMATMSESSSGLFGGGGGLGSLISTGLSLFMPGLGSLFGGGFLPSSITGSFGIPASANYVPGIYHGGGIVGETAVPHRLVDPSIFTGAVRLHGGLRYDEFPAILQKGETVIPKEKAATYHITIPITIHGSVISEHELARKLVPKINKAVKEGVH